MTALQSIIKEAKAIRRKKPSMEWKKAVAQASAIYASKHKGKSPVGKKKAVKKKASKRKVSGVKDSAKVRKELASKGLKMPHGYATTKRKRIGSVKKKKISEQSILNKIHRVKDEVSKLDEAQHKHMIGIGSLAIEKYKKTINDIASLERALHRNIQQMKLHQNKQPHMKQWFSKTNAKLKSYISELKTHAKELKKHI